MVDFRQELDVWRAKRVVGGENDLNLEYPVRIGGGFWSNDKRCVKKKIRENENKKEDLPCHLYKSPSTGSALP